MTYYDKDDVFEFYWGIRHSTWELFAFVDVNNPKAVRDLAEKLLVELGPTDDQTPPHASELALLLAANAHAYGREFCAEYGQAIPLSFEEKECAARGWSQK